MRWQASRNSKRHWIRATSPSPHSKISRFCDASSIFCIRRRRPFRRSFSYFPSSSSVCSRVSAFSPRDTLTLILQQIAVVGILGAAQTLVILTAGIDLSIGVIMVLSAVVMGNCAVTYGMPAPLAVAAGFVIGGPSVVCMNGFLVSRMKLPPFIVTLGTWNIVMADEFHLFRQCNDPPCRYRNRSPLAWLLRYQPQARFRRAHARRHHDGDSGDRLSGMR